MNTSLTIFVLGFALGMMLASHYPKHLWTALRKRWLLLKGRRASSLLLRKRVQHRGFCAHQFHNQPKPLWVRREVIHLKALCPNAGCRAVETRLTVATHTAKT